MHGPAFHSLSCQIAVLGIALQQPLPFQKTAEAAGVGVFESLTDFTSVTTALERAVDRFGSRLRLVGVRASQFSPELRASAREYGIPICIEGMWHLDDDLRLNSDSASWMAAIRKNADAYFT